jgi:hypothetical protein
MHPLNPPVGTALAVLGALSYPMLLLFVLGSSFSPFNADASWGLAAEHGELELELQHWSHVVVAISSALPLATALKLAAHKFSLPLLLASSGFAALPYAAQSTHSFAANDGWLANYTWQLAAVEVVLAPLLVVATLATVAWLKKHTR